MYCGISYTNGVKLDLVWYFPYMMGELVLLGIVLYEVSWFQRRRKEKQIEKENQMERTRKFHHDISKHMTALKELSKNNDGQYLAELEEEYEKIIPITYCDNSVVNAILLNKIKECEKYEITMDIKMKQIDIGHMREIDMVALLANVLDNAIEACMKITNNKKR